MGGSRKQTRKKMGNKTLKKELESAEEPKTHATGVSEKLPDVSAMEDPGSPSGPIDLCQTSTISSQQGSPTVETPKNNPDVCTSKADKDGDSEFECESPRWDTEEAMTCPTNESAAFSYTEDSATEGAGKEGDITYLVKVREQVERNNKVVEGVCKLVNPTHDYDDEVPTSDDEDIEWVTGDFKGYKYKVSKEVQEEGERMSYWELQEDISIRQERIAEKLERNTKAMMAMDRWAKFLDEVDGFEPPAFMFATPEPVTSK
ncbi:hypothetical protein COCOBI_13-1220 [Coccomyxa sp. Obi]|nr:hypothetical protein COCOBI_13-1220 [Coccomyxa sp. Obi]